MCHPSLLAVLAALLPALAGAAPPVHQRELLGGVAWIQQAPEARLAILGIYRNAIAALPAAIASRGSAAGEQRGGTAGKRNAVIVDVDETVLDNSPFQAWLVAQGKEYHPDDWARWVSLRSAAAVPGALEFARAAAAAQVDIFYVTNRACAPGEQPCRAKQDTMANLLRLGFPRADDEKAFLLKGENGWAGDKSARRAAIAGTHRIVMMVGDDMRDFLSGPDAEALHRRDRKVTGRAEAQLGKRWFVIPNPMYGSWLERLGDDADGRYAALTAAALPANERVTLATWNLEWLMTPQTYRELKATCTPDPVPSNKRGFPCTPGRESVPARSAADYDALARVATALPADVVALQETDGPEAAATVFRQGWQLACFTSRAHPQKVGFAIRDGIDYACNPELKELDVDGMSRSGADITLFPGTPRAIRLLAVHLKSGCFAGSLAGPDAGPVCATLRRQIPVLEQWIDARAAEHARFAVLGDFNRRLELDAVLKAGADEAQPEALFSALSDAQPPGAVLLRATAGQPHVRCSPLDYHPPGSIDNILVSRSLAALARLTYTRLPFDGALAKAHKFPDHCPGLLTIE